MQGHYSTWSAAWHARNPNWLLGNRSPSNPFNPGPEKETEMTLIETIVDTLKAVGLDVTTLPDNEAGQHIAASMADAVNINADVTSGWEPRSGNSPYQRFVIFEVGDKVRQQAFKAWALEQKLGFKELIGKWKGQQAASFIVEDTSTNRIKLAYWLIGQEAILVLGPAWRYDPAVGTNRLFGNRLAQLEWLDSDGYQVREIEAAGKFQAVGREQALAGDSWTYDPVTEAYYILV